MPRLLGLLALCSLVAACDTVWNDPYPSGEEGRALVHDFLSERPKHLDPAQSYAEPESWVNYQIYESLYGYEYLKRPYTLRPELAAEMPRVHYLDARRQPLDGEASKATNGNADEARAAEGFSVYEIPIRRGVRYQPHPAFARDAAGRSIYIDNPAARLAEIRSLAELKQTGTRELVANDFIYAIKRLARPKLHSPAFEVFRAIDGMEDLSKRLRADAKARRIDPDGWIDLDRYPVAGLEAPDPYTLRITIRGRYPQLIYWLAMGFTAPIPPEVDRFFSQRELAAHNISLDTWPVGTGPYMMVKHEENREILLLKNPNWRGETYPCEGSAEDRAKGLLADCGKPLPLNDGIKWVREREGISFWNKFLQGYYDEFASNKIRLSSIDNILVQGANGLDAAPKMRERGVRVDSEVDAGVWYYSFNMLDPIWGAQDKDKAAQERARKLRQAVSIAMDIEEYIQVFAAGIGQAAQGPIPPGIPGYREGASGLNPYVYDWADDAPRRKPIAYAQRLMAEAGYPNGRDAKTGEPLILYMDIAAGMRREQLDWLQRKLRPLGVQMVPRPTDFNRFQEKVQLGNYQVLYWGWSADYPDPENFLFLFYGKNAKATHQGENVSNYANPEFDGLFERLRTMELNDPQRLALVDRMVELVRRDAPWIYVMNDTTISLSNAWMHNSKPARMLRAVRKYQRIDPLERERRIAQWNAPVLWPIAALVLLLGAAVVVGWRQYRRHERAQGRTEGTD